MCWNPSRLVESHVLSLCSCLSQSLKCGTEARSPPLCFVDEAEIRMTRVLFVQPETKGSVTRGWAELLVAFLETQVQIIQDSSLGFITFPSFSAQVEQRESKHIGSTQTGERELRLPASFTVYRQEGGARNAKWREPGACQEGQGARSSVLAQPKKPTQLSSYSFPENIKLMPRFYQSQWNKAWFLKKIKPFVWTKQRSFQKGESPRLPREQKLTRKNILLWVREYFPWKDILLWGFPKGMNKFCFHTWAGGIKANYMACKAR